MLTVVVDGGAIRIGGQDLGQGVSAAFGDAISEYEWDWTLDARDIDRAIEALGGRSGEDLVAVLARWAEANGGRDPGQFLKEAGLKLRFWSRMGD
jgi:hypothetical protein